MSVDPQDDEDLGLVEEILAAPEGDTRAFETLVERHKQGVLANCRYITRSAGDAEDLAQDVFLKVYFALRRFERRAKFRTWLRRIKANHCLNHVKKSEGKQFVDVDDEAVNPPEALRVEPDVWDKVDAEDAQARIAAVIDQMNDTLRVPLILCDMDEMSYQEIADLLGIKLSAVKMRIKRAREEFRTRYEAAGESAGA
ncbi:MAG: RNA polymerase sigma factor [bacterium]|nr:RNA polymerase sigma factor [bacterium]